MIDALVTHGTVITMNPSRDVLEDGALAIDGGAICRHRAVGRPRGAPIVAIKDWMGHSNIETTMIYVDWAPDPHGAAWIVNGFAPRNNGSNNGYSAAADQLSATLLPS